MNYIAKEVTLNTLFLSILRFNFALQLKKTPQNRRNFLFLQSFWKMFVKLIYLIVHLHVIPKTLDSLPIFKKIDITVNCFLPKDKTFFRYCNFSKQFAWFLLLTYTDDFRFYGRFYCNNINLAINVGNELVIYRGFTNIMFLFWHSTSKRK